MENFKTCGNSSRKQNLKKYQKTSCISLPGSTVTKYFAFSLAISVSFPLSLYQYVLRPRCGLGQTLKFLDAGFGNRTRFINITEREYHNQEKQFKGQFLDSFLVPETDMIFGDE